MYGLIKDKWKKDDSETPVYQQIASFIEEAIASGDLPPDYILPGHRRIAELFGVGINTILHALHILQNSDVIKLSPRSRPVVSKSRCGKPNWCKYINSSLYNPTKSNFFSFADSHYGSLNLSMGLDKDYYFRELFNEVLPHISIPPVMRSHPLGLPLLRDEICSRMVKHRIEAGQDNVMIVTSVFHALNILFIGLLGHGTNLVVPKPCNISISNLVRTTGANIVEIPMDNEGMITDKIKKTLYSSGNCIMCLSPDQNTPTGTITSLKRRLEILDICAKHKTPIIEHTLFPLGCTLTDIPSMKSLDKSGMVIHVSQIGATGSTNPWLGWMIADEYLLKQLNHIRFNLDAHQNYLMQIATLEVFKTGRYDTYLERILDVRKKRFGIVEDLLEKYMKDIATWNSENIDSSVWLKFKEGINTFNIYKEAGEITFHPGKFYDENDTEHIFLYPVALSMENFEKGLNILAEYAKRQTG